MEAWMHFDAMLANVFQQPGAYPYPFGSTNLQGLSAMTDTDLRRLPLPRLRDQAVAIDAVFEHFKGRYLALWELISHVGPTPYLVERLTETARTLRRIQTQQQRVRALLDEAPQPRQVLLN